MAVCGGMGQGRAQLSQEISGDLRVAIVCNKVDAPPGVFQAGTGAHNGTTISSYDSPKYGESCF